jgi:hypothetical protein
MDLLPLEIIYQICAHLQYKDVVNFSMTNKRYVMGESFWNYKSLTDFDINLDKIKLFIETFDGKSYNVSPGGILLSWIDEVRQTQIG